MLDEQGLDAVILSRGAFKRWLAGFALSDPDDPSHGYAGTLVVTRDATLILADSRYTEQVAAQCPDWELVFTTGSAPTELAAVLSRLTVRRCGAEARIIDHATWTGLEAAAADVEFVAVDGALTPLRIVKDEAEIVSLGRATAVTDDCFVHLLDWITPGRREVEIAWEVERFFREAGADGLAFPTIALVGPRAAMPHGEPSDERVVAGQPVLIDFGARVDGYRADMTRTVFVGAPDDESRRLYELVLGAQQAAEAAVAPGVAGTDIHAVARDHIAAAGVEPFAHGLGHGIGLQTHEPPALSRRGYPGQDGRSLEVGMTFTIEPGIYQPGRIGIRIEDDYLLAADGLRRLTQSPNHLITI
jgi:Xaa-Pro aminopeptidase